MGFLTDIVAQTRDALRDAPPDATALRSEIDVAPEARNLAWTLRGYAAEEGVAVIAEVKRASPSAGDIAPDADPVLQATAYDAGGAAAISVLTEPRHFAGSLEDLRAVRRAVLHPVLRKDFIVDPAQLLEARAAGADAALLIAAALDGASLAEMVAASRELGMEPLVEAHTDADLERVLATDAEIVGINARDLESLVVDVPAALTRLAAVPPERVAVLESGVSSRAHVEAAVGAGASAILVGESLMRASDPAAKIRELVRGTDGEETP